MKMIKLTLFKYKDNNDEILIDGNINKNKLISYIISYVFNN